MPDDWLEQLKQLHEADKAKHLAQTQAEAGQKKQQAAHKNQASQLLRRSKAYPLLRQVQKALLNGQGLLDIFEAESEYDRTISLVWQGPISHARRPNPEDAEDFYYITVGVKKGKLWVNGKAVSAATPEALKAALLQASKNPGRQKHGQ